MIFVSALMPDKLAINRYILVAETTCILMEAVLLGIGRLVAS
jgi:hypothetical protein